MQTYPVAELTEKMRFYELARILAEGIVQWHVQRCESQEICDESAPLGLEFPDDTVLSVDSG